MRRAHAHRGLSLSVALVISLLASSPRRCLAFWGDLIEAGAHHHAGDGGVDRSGDASVWGGSMCALAVVVGTPSNLGFGIYDTVAWGIHRRPPVGLAVTEIVISLSEVVICAIGIGVLAAPTEPVTLGDNAIFIGFNVAVLLPPLLLAIHGIYEAAVHRNPAPAPPSTDAVSLVPVLVSDGGHAGMGLGVAGRF